LEPAQLAELSGVTEDQAEEIIAFAEEGSVRVEEEGRLAREADAAAGTEAPARSTAASRAAGLFPPDEATRVEAKPTVESLFGPDATSKPDESLSAAQVFGDTPPAAAPPEEEPASE